jgi:(1->4)-alpha-D-glucan 1-alpha-D-glucosylmutase
VDYGRRQSLLNRISGLLAEIDSGAQRSAPALDELVRSRSDGRIKLYVTAAALHARRDDPDLLLRGEYMPLPVTGARAAHVFAFGRAFEGRALVTIVPRLTATLLPDAMAAPIGRELWADTTVQLPGALAGAEWHSLFTGDSLAAVDGGVRAGEALQRFPVALLMAGRQRS